MATKPRVTVESFPGERGLNARTSHRWFARAACEGMVSTAYGATRSGAERKAVRWARERAKKYRRQVR